MQWCDLYQKCKYYSFEYYNFDIFGHDSIISRCEKTGEKREIYPRISCKKCSEMKKMMEQEDNKGTSDC